jgi:hypothetical protein
MLQPPRSTIKHSAPASQAHMGPPRAHMGLGLPRSGQATIGGQHRSMVPWYHTTPHPPSRVWPLPLEEHCCQGQGGPRPALHDAGNGKPLLATTTKGGGGRRGETTEEGGGRPSPSGVGGGPLIFGHLTVGIKYQTRSIIVKKIIPHIGQNHHIYVLPPIRNKYCLLSTNFELRLYKITKTNC